MKDLGRRRYRFLVAIACVGVVVFATRFPILASYVVVVLCAAVLASAWYGGFAAGAVTTGLVTALAAVASYRDNGGFTLGVLAGISTFAMLGLLTSYSLETLHVAQARTERDRRWLDSVVSSIGDAVIAVDEDARVTFANSVAEQLTGWPRDELVGKPLGEVFVIIDDRTRERLVDPVARVLQTEKVQGLANPTLLIARDGAERPIATNAAPIRERSGAVTGVVLVFRDVSIQRENERAREALNRELRDNDRRKDEFLAMLSHELRNPIGAIQNAVHVARLTSTEPETIDALDMANRQLRHLGGLLIDLLDLSRISHGKIELSREPVEVSGAVRHALESVRVLADSKRQVVKTELPSEAMFVSADRTRFEQIIGNLLTNAIKYSRDGSVIRVSARPGGKDELILEVDDNGIGIPKQDLAKIFDLFVQGARDSSRAGGGLGIGLTLVRKLVEMHGGRVSAASDGIGRGSTFTVVFPRIPEPGESADSPALNGMKVSRRVLIVDDHHDSAASVARLLELQGHITSVAFDGPEALKRAVEFRPHVVLLDIGLPGMDGHDVAASLRTLDGGRDLVLIALSGYAHAKDKRRSREAGFDHHLAKPLSFDALCALLPLSRNELARRAADVQPSI